MPDLTSAQVVMISGVSGSGKTHLAKQYESQGYKRLSLDEIAWRENKHDIAQLPAPEQQSIYQYAHTQLLCELRQYLVVGEKVVLDATFCRRCKRDDVRQICREHHASCQLIFIQADISVIAEALRHRKGSGPDDQPVPPERFRLFLKNFEIPQADEDAVVIRR